LTFTIGKELIQWGFIESRAWLYALEESGHYSPGGLRASSKWSTL